MTSHLYRDLSFLKRHPDLQKRYESCCNALQAQYGSVGKLYIMIRVRRLHLKAQTVKYLIHIRLEWPDLDPISASSSQGELSTYRAFQADLSDQYRVILNDWPYSGVSPCKSPWHSMTANLVPHDVEHWIIWSRVPIVSPSNERIDKLGLWGFTGTEGCEEATLPEGITPPPPPTQEEASLIEGACQEIEKCVRARWQEPHWECAWFMNPPVSDSSPPRRQKFTHTSHCKAFRVLLTSISSHDRGHRPPSPHEF